MLSSSVKVIVYCAPTLDFSGYGLLEEVYSEDLNDHQCLLRKQTGFKPSTGVKHCLFGSLTICFYLASNPEGKQVLNCVVFEY